MVTGKGQTTPAANVKGRSEWSPGIFGPVGVGRGGRGDAQCGDGTGGQGSGEQATGHGSPLSSNIVGALHGGRWPAQAHREGDLRSALIPPYSGSPCCLRVSPAPNEGPGTAVG